MTGFCEGESTFTFSRNGAQLALYFGVKLTAAERPLLEALQAFFGGVGRIYKVKAREAPTPRSGFTKEAVYYRVCRRDELPRIVDHFDEHPLRGGKKESYRFWRQMVLLKQNFRQPAREQLDALAARLSNASVRNLPFRGQGSLKQNEGGGNRSR